jgi:hypothetical protein
MVDALQGWVRSHINPSTETTLEMKFFACLIIEETLELPHQSSIVPVISLLLYSEHEVASLIITDTE